MRRKNRRNAPMNGVRRRRRRRSRYIYKVRDQSSGQTYVVKRYSRRIDALRERRVMQAYGQTERLVRFHKYFARGRRGYIVMEWLDGDTLGQVIKKHGPLSVDKVVAISLDILAGLETLHGLGYVHGDLHSENVIVTDFYRPSIKIIDFQHAVRIGPSGKAFARRRLLRPTMKLAPESRQRRIDQSYDVYGVGYMCAYMLTATRPTRFGLRRLAQQDGAIWQVIGKSTHRDPKQRYQSAQEMAADLNAVRRG